MARSNSKRKSTVLCYYGKECAWCSTPLNRTNATIDHVRCLSAGGSNWLGNLLPACVPCNEARADMDAREWFTRCLEAGKTVRLALVRGALERASQPRADKAFESAYQLAEQRKRAQTWTLARAFEGLLTLAY